jgi:uncharacterized membrane protein YqgA involved in biofilm formation
MFLAGTLLNALAILIGATIGVLVGARMPARIQQTLTDGLGLFTLAIAFALALQMLLDRTAPTGTDLIVLASLLVGGAVGEVLKLTERVEGIGDWFQSRLARGDRPSRISEAFVTASLVFCVGPLTILGSIQNGLTGDIQLLAVKSVLDGFASIAFAAALGAGVYLSILTVLVIQGGIATLAYAFGAQVDPVAIAAASAVGGIILLGVGFRLLDLKRIRVISMLPALVIAPVLVLFAEALNVWPTRTP